MQKNRGLALGAALLVLWGLHHMPYRGVMLYPLMLFDTLMHEMGHGLTALLVGGQLHRLDLFSDGSGLAHTATSGGWKTALVAAGGLLGPPFMAAFAFGAAQTPRGARAWLVGMSLFILATLAFFVRGGMAWPFLLVIGLVLLVLGLKGNTAVTQVSTLVVACELSVLTYSRSDYLFMPSATVNGVIHTSDVGLIARALHLPYWLWGICLGLLSALLILWEIRSFLRATRQLQ
ncbi:M50 family metallopeptidase [bacterium]|nr:M50 family metallopeptidase [bacterium]